MDALRTPKQSRAIQACRRWLDLDLDEYQTLLAQYRVLTCVDPDRAGQPVDSSKRLSRSQARDLLTRFALRGAPIGGPYSGHRPAPGAEITTLATPAQRALIERLKDEVPWRLVDGYQRWLRAKLHLSAVRTYRDAEAVIEGLKGLAKHAA